MRNLFLSVLGSIALVAPVQAATYNFQQAYTISDGTSGESINEIDNFLALDGDVTRTRSASVPGVSAQSTFSIDRATGVVKVGASIEHDTGVNGQLALTRLDIRGIFTATGTGTATFKFDLDGVLGAQADFGFASIDTDMRIARWTGNSAPGQLTVEDEFSASLSMLGTQNAARQVINGIQTDVALSPTSPLQAAFPINSVLELSYDVLDGSAFSVEIGLLAQSRLSNAGGSIDANFLNTGYLSFETSQGLSLTAADPLFLSQATGRPSGVSPVPLPASAALLLVGLAGLGLFRRQRA